jgi:2C-methyl-D-erythritol 2,4-cyclodiphosphate synthase
MASAILALVFPEKYAVIDYRSWRRVFEKEKRDFSACDYKEYLRRIRKLAQELGWQPQEVDLAIWAYDMKHEKTKCC